MAIPHAFPGMPVDLLPDEQSPSSGGTIALVKNNTFEAIRLVLPKGREVCHDHPLEAVITAQCLQGRAALTIGDATHELPAGYWLFLLSGDPHTLRGIEDSVVLLTLIFPQRS